MLDLSPVKLLVIAIVALVVLGPDKLPHVARQVGAAWSQLRGWRARLEAEVRGSFPDLPDTGKLAEAVRSPLGFLDRLAQEHEDEQAKAAAASGSDGSGEPGPTGDRPPEAGAGPLAPVGPGLGGEPPVPVFPRPALLAVPDDPSMN